MEKVEGTKYERVQDILFKILQNENKHAAPSPSGNNSSFLSLELKTALTKYLLNSSNKKLISEDQLQQLFHWYSEKEVEAN